MRIRSKIKCICECVIKNIKISTITATILLTLLNLPLYATDIKYSYDSLNRLIRADYSNGIRVEYAYDEVGNRLGKETSQSPDSDGDTQFDNWDNCPTISNPTQVDTYPPQGNGIGDTCDCEANFDCDRDVDANDVTPFLLDFGRSQYNRPCTNQDPCKGDFSCDGDVDANDVSKFLEDFGRSQYNKPCPICTQGQPWCVYP